MINMDQVRTLEMKVKQTVQLIVQLRKENDSLRSRLSDAEVRLLELDAVLDGYKATQTEMETGIRSALRELDHVGDVESVEDHSSSMAEPEFVPEPARVESPVIVAEPEPEFTSESEYVAEPEPEPAVEAPEIRAEEFPVAEESQERVTPPDEPEVEEEAEPQQPGLGIF